MSVVRPSRVAGLSLALLTASLAWAPAASAAPELTVPLSPPELILSLAPVENGGVLDPAAPFEETPWQDVAVQWGGSVVVELPAELDGSAMEATLELAPTVDDVATRTYSTTEPAPDDLTLTDLGAGRYELDLPADDIVNGPFGYLVFDAITAVAGEEYMVAPLVYELEFTGTGSSTVPLTTQIVALGTSPCALSSDDPCAPYPVTPGSSFTLAVPADSALRTLGLGSLATTSVVLQRVDDDGLPVEEDPVGLVVEAARSSAERLPELLAATLAGEGGDGDDVPLTQAAGQVTPVAPYEALVTLPDDLRTGLYDVTVLEGGPAAASLTYLRLDVRPVPQAAPVLNAGLRSETGWTEPSGDGPATPLVLLGAGMLLTAGLVGAAVLRSGRRGAACDG